MELMQRRAAYIGIPWASPPGTPGNTDTKHIAPIHSRALVGLGSGPMPPYIIGRHRDSQK